MNEQKNQIKLAFITGLKEIVLDEIKSHASLHIVREGVDSLYLNLVTDLSIIKGLKSVARAYLTVQDIKYNPIYISNHKSILGNLVEEVINTENKKAFTTFKVTCAGADSNEVRSIAGYIEKTYGLVEKEDADLKAHIIKIGDTWEVGVQIGSRPLSVREYKVKNMSGAMDPTIAYAVNSLCSLETAHSYLNAFSGSATLLIEAALEYPGVEHFVGFDNDKKHISLAVQNVTKAGLIKKIQLKEKDILDKPDLGMFDAITADLPFGMSISKGKDLEKVYRSFVEYCQGALREGGSMVAYTSEYEILEKVLRDSKFKITKKLEVQFVTSINAYLRPKILVCKFK